MGAAKENLLVGSQQGDSSAIEHIATQVVAGLTQYDGSFYGEGCVWTKTLGLQFQTLLELLESVFRKGLHLWKPEWLKLSTGSTEHGDINCCQSTASLWHISVGQAEKDIPGLERLNSKPGKK